MQCSGLVVVESHREQLGGFLEHGERGSLGGAVTFDGSPVTLHEYSDLPGSF